MRSRIRKASSKKRMLISALLMLLLFLSIGYATLSESIKLNAIASVDKMTWDVHLENIVVRSGSISTSTPIISNDKTSVTFSVSFKQPNEYYEFYIDIVNKGSIDAQVDSFFKTTLSNNQAKYMEYKITYKDETEIKRNDILASGEKETLKVLVYIKDLHPSLYPSINANLELKGQINYIQKDSDGKIRNKNSLYEQIVKETQLDTSINFGAISSDTNGKGVYTLSRTSHYAYPVSYYRGEIDNNNVLFGGFCWKIVRTTSTGGIKLIYNGLPTSGMCNNTMTADIYIGRSAFNTEKNDPKYMGYMYDNNTKDSTIKGVVDSWFASNLLEYQDYLEDTPFYNERDYVEGENSSNFFVWPPRVRMWGKGTNYAEFIPKTTIKLGATNVSDIFTISNSNGNGALTYPIGLLTSDEAIMAGGRGVISDTDGGANRKYYLYTGSDYWTISPGDGTFGSKPGMYFLSVLNNGSVRNNGITDSLWVRPVVSLQPSTTYLSGDGTSNSPYQITK